MMESLRLSKYPDDWNATHRYQVQSWNFLIIQYYILMLQIVSYEEIIKFYLDGLFASRSQPLLSYSYSC